MTSAVMVAEPAADFGVPVRTVTGRAGLLAPLTIDLHRPLPAEPKSDAPVAMPVFNPLCDALEAVLGEYADPDAEEIDQADAQLRTVLPLLVRVADWRPGPAVTEAVDRVQTVWAEARSGGALRIRGQTRRLAVAVLGLVDLLVEALS
ncbi:DUF6415 family natural product biosynthesis protein [Streptomyces sp. NPDC056672]|uniref:DUF6415 family natural product biosynthesis protein n=1 Tax=Streptomyces sp. NPDC056672 TaxID=3345906 RepID=UPI00367D9288